MTELLPMNTSHLPVKLTLDDYMLLDGSGAFADYQKTELIDGEIFFMNAQHRPHAVVKSRLFRRIADALDVKAQGWEAIVEGSIAIPPKNSPEPDIVVTTAPDGSGLIPVDSVKLIVEVSDTTLAFDMKQKRAMYARNGIIEYWVVDVSARTIHQFWAPGGEDYAEHTNAAFGDVISSRTSDLTVATDGL